MYFGPKSHAPISRAGASSGDVLTFQADGTFSFQAPTGGGGLANIVEDTTPQLGGDLDMNGKNIDFPTTANISDCLDEDNMASDSVTALATQQSIKAYVDSQVGGATTALDNLASVQINTTLVSDADITDDLGTGDVRWRDIYSATLNAGLTVSDTLILRGRDVDGTAWIDILTITSANIVTADLNTIVTIGGASIVTPATTDTFTNKTLDDFSNEVHADQTHMEVRNTTGSTINKAQPVYISGYNAGQDLPEVTSADSDGAGTMPAIGLLSEDLTTGSNGECTVSGRISSIDTSAWTAGDKLFVSDTPATTLGLTNTKPNNADDQVQKVAIVLRSHASLGVIEVFGAGRTNDIPAIMLDTVVRIVDDGDNTKIAMFQSSSITTGNTRTFTFPDNDGTLITSGNLSDITTVGALNAGSITSGFGTIDNATTIKGTVLTATAAESIVLGTASSTAGGLVFQNATNANTIKINSGVTSTSYVLTLPLAVAGAGEVLTDAAGDGVLSWAAGGGATLTEDVTQTTHGLAVGDWIKSSGTNDEYAKAQANSAANAEVVGVVTTVTDANNFTFTYGGMVSVAAAVPNQTAGTVMFLNPSAEGAIVTTETSTNGEISKPVIVIVEANAQMLLLTMRGMEITAADTTPFAISIGGTGASDAATAIANLGGLPVAGGTMTGDITLGENTSVALDPAGSADGKYTGTTIAGTGGATIAFGDLLYLDVTAGEWLLADADLASTAGDVVLGMAVTISTDGNPVTVLLNGTIRAAVFPASIALGAPLYAGLTAGDIVTTAPSATDQVVRVVGWAVTVEPNTIYFNPSSDYITII